MFEFLFTGMSHRVQLLMELLIALLLGDNFVVWFRGGFSFWIPSTMRPRVAPVDKTSVTTVDLQSVGG